MHWERGAEIAKQSTHKHHRRVFIQKLNQDIVRPYWAVIIHTNERNKWLKMSKYIEMSFTHLCQLLFVNMSSDCFFFSLFLDFFRAAVKLHFHQFFCLHIAYMAIKTKFNDNYNKQTQSTMEQHKKLHCIFSYQ